MMELKRSSEAGTCRVRKHVQIAVFCVQGSNKSLNTFVEMELSNLCFKDGIPRLGLLLKE